jgi:uncharacterized protein (DUF983 family)
MINEIIMQNISQKDISHSTVMTRKTKLSKLQAMAQCKCPVCTKGDMFKSKATNLKKFNELKQKCEVCGFRLMPEPGFYQISLFFTYAINVIIFVIFGFAAYFLLNEASIWTYGAIIAIPSIVAVPWNLRYSKVIMLYIFGGVWES